MALLVDCSGARKLEDPDSSTALEMEVAKYLVEILPRGHLVLVNYMRDPGKPMQPDRKIKWTAKNMKRQKRAGRGVLVVDPSSRLTLIEVRPNTHASQVDSEILVNSSEGRSPIFEDLRIRQKRLQKALNTRLQNLKAHIIKGLVVLPKLPTIQNLMLGKNRTKIAHGSHWREQLERYFVGSSPGSSHPAWIDLIKKRIDPRICPEIDATATHHTPKRNDPPRAHTPFTRLDTQCPDIPSLRLQIEARLEDLLKDPHSFNPEDILCVSTQIPSDLANETPRQNVPVHDMVRLGRYVLRDSPALKPNSANPIIKLRSAGDLGTEKYPVILLIQFADNEDSKLLQRATNSATSAVYVFTLGMVKPTS